MFHRITKLIFHYTHLDITTEPNVFFSQTFENYMYIKNTYSKY